MLFLHICGATVQLEEIVVFTVCRFLAYFFADFAAIKKAFSKNLNACTILILDATFVTTLTFLGLLSPGILFGEKQSPRHPAYFAIAVIPLVNAQLCPALLHIKNTKIPKNLC